MYSHKYSCLEAGVLEETSEGFSVPNGAKLPSSITLDVNQCEDAGGREKVHTLTGCE